MRRAGRALTGTLVALILLAGTHASSAEGPAPFDAARAFGARQSLCCLSLSPDGSRAAYIVPSKGQGTALYTAAVAAEEKPRLVLTLDGNPMRLNRCHWVSNERLVCQAFGIIRESARIAELLPVSRWIAVDMDGRNLTTLATRRTEYSQGYFLRDGDVIDLLPEEDGAVLMSREYTPDAHLGSRSGSEQEGLGVDWVDTRTLKVRNVIAPRSDAFEYLTDGHGVVRVMGTLERDADGYERGRRAYYYRPPGSTDWRKLSQFNERDGTGWQPLAVDAELNVAYGVRRLEGRSAVFSVKLDDSREERLVYSRPDVDVTELVRIGRRQRVVGANYESDRAASEIFDPAIRQVLGSLTRALPQSPLISVTDASADEAVLAVLAEGDNDPGVYYVLDRRTHRLASFGVVRPELEGVALATMKSVTYPAGDGTSIPAYLTMPPGREHAQGLPAIVLPHGGPRARDEWGFDWLPQYFAHQGYAVLQPEFRGSAGYGEEWLVEDGYRSWRVAVGDVLAAGHWLVKEGVADPARLGVLGWSYGGYAALQSTTVDPTLFKAVIAVAPVTDLPALVEEWRHWSGFALKKREVGVGRPLHEGSPIEHAEAFKAPVLLFHGTLDRNVGYLQSKRFAEKLKSAGASVELVTFENLDHQLEDAAARTELLGKSDAFLTAAFGHAVASQ